ncbi:hypothetical protein Q7P35_005727 [Cladosporium inversicolor]
MSTSEKKEPAPDVKVEERIPMGASEVISCLTLSICSAALGLTSTTRIDSNDGFQEGVVKLLPQSGAAVFISAVVLHAMLLRDVWTGLFPDERMSHGRRFAWNSYCCAFTLGDWRHYFGFHTSALCALAADSSLLWALRRAREAGEPTAPLREASMAEKGHTLTAEPSAEKSHASTAESTAEHNHRPSSTLPRLTIALMLVFSSAGFFDLATALYSETIETALTFFGDHVSWPLWWSHR